MRLEVLMQGKLRGMGRQENCELLATKDVSSTAARPVYSHIAIIGAPADLPDGEYEVEFGGEVAWTRREKGLWMVGQTMPQTRSEMSAFLEAGNGPGGRPKIGIEDLSRGGATRTPSTAIRK